MKRNKRSRFALALCMALTLLFAAAQPILAASVKENLVTQVTFKSALGGGSYLYTYKYNAKGLLTQKTTGQQDGGTSLQVDYQYNANNLVKSVTGTQGGQKMATGTNTYNAKKQLTRRVIKSAVNSEVLTTVYTWKNGQVTKSVLTYKGSPYYADGTKVTKTYTWNAKGMLSGIRLVNSANKKLNGSNSYTYDANGFLKAYGYSNGYDKGSITRKLTYKNGRLTKYVDTDHNSGESYTDVPRSITVKTVSVPKAASAIVKRQQQEIINGSYGTDFYLGYE